jgi:uncharacterized membrane protein YraQ (UPF0718 family)
MEAPVLAELTEIIRLFAAAFLHLAPYLLLTIPLAVAIQVSGASRFLEQALSSRPSRAILLATLVGAFSPFCSCGVIPVVASLLLGGVPLAPVMAFWIASPSMDPEIFLLSVGTLGWKLACWRLGGTLFLSLAAGYLTQALVVRGWLETDFLRLRPANAPGFRSRFKSALRRVRDLVVPSPLPEAAIACCQAATTFSIDSLPQGSAFKDSDKPPCHSENCQKSPTPLTSATAPTLVQRLARETASATWLVARFMALALVLEVLMIRYLSTDWIAGLLGTEQPLAIPLAATIGVPLYTTNLTALAVIGGLVAQGMSGGAALAFLIAGATTTLPAMAAVWGLVRMRVFLLYLSLVFGGAIAVGTALHLMQATGIG